MEKLAHQGIKKYNRNLFYLKYRARTQIEPLKLHQFDLARGDPLTPIFSWKDRTKMTEEQKQTKAKRTKSITVWLTDDEYQELHNKKTRSRIGAWVRETCLGVQSKKRKYKPVDPQLLRELGKIGGNLNQIAKHANTDAQGGLVNKIRLVRELVLIREQLDELLKRYDS